MKDVGRPRSGRPTSAVLAAFRLTGGDIAEPDSTQHLPIPGTEAIPLPLDRHDWHAGWNCTLRPREHDRPPSDPGPFGQPSPDLAWLCHPALTGIPPDGWDALITRLMTLHGQQRETAQDKRRGHRPRLAAPGTGRRPVRTLAGRLLATILHHRPGLPQAAIAALFRVRPETVSKRIRDVRQFLDQAAVVIDASGARCQT